MAEEIQPVPGHFTRQLAPDIWWAYVTRPVPKPITSGSIPMQDWRVEYSHVDFTGDLFQGPYAEALAKAWKPA